LPPDDHGYEIRLDGVPRTFWEKRETAFDAARYAKAKARGEIIEIVGARRVQSW
jgi:hypothetical protein